MFALSDRVKNLPPYLFARIDAMKQEASKKGVDVIDLSIGDPDIPTPEHIVAAMKKAVENPPYHRYPSSAGMLGYREAVSAWYKKRFAVTLDPANEVISVIGSKEGIGHLPFAFVNPGDIVLVPSPGYPVYSIGTLFAGGEPYEMPLRSDNDFLPDFSVIPESIFKRTKIMWLNYPNNPTAAVAGEDFYRHAIGLAQKYGFIICHDAAYSEMFYDGNRPISFLEVEGAREVGIEMHSLSKTYNMTGWRVGYAVGNKDVIAGLLKIKSNMDSGLFEAIQAAAITALATEDTVLDGIRSTYQARRDTLVAGLRSIGLEAHNPKATFYVWTKVPKGFNSESYTEHLLKNAGIMITPGNGFGEPGEGYIRFALTASVQRIAEAVQRIKGM